MLATNTFPPDVIATARDRAAATLAGWRRLVDAATSPDAAAALHALEPTCFGNALVALDAPFVHRLRAAEGKDGNPLNEVRLLCGALLGGDGVLRAERSIRYDPARAVLGLAVGERVQLRAEQFGRIADAFLDEIARRYGVPAERRA